MTEHTLRTRLTQKPIVIAPGIYDPLTALLAEQAGFEAAYVSGAAIAYTRLGRPDIGLVSRSEVAETPTLIRVRVGTYLIADADTGYGNALNVERTVRLFERAGANAIQLEDQDFPKRCGHLDDKVLIPAQEMAGKIKAAVDARTSRETLIIARTDAVAVEGLARALAKAAQEFYGALKRDGTTDAFRPRMFDFHALNDLIGTPETLARGQWYADYKPGKNCCGRSTRLRS